VSDDNTSKEALREALKEEVAQLLCSSTVSEEEKLLRLQIAQYIIESNKE
jgi:hypothetical protein